MKSVAAVFTAAAVLFSVLAAGQGAERSEAQAPQRAKNVILFIGDGMGAAHRNAVRLATVGMKGELAMDDMPYAGLIHTTSTVPVTDSAAAATAIATGVKTYNGAIGMNADRQPVRTILEIAKEAGKATGIVTTSQVTDATGAAFGAHVENRSAQSDIALQYLTVSKVDVILGGGEDFWFPAGEPGAFPDEPAEDPSEKSRGTQGNLVERAKRLGYTYVKNRQELQNAKGGKLLGLFANEEMFQQRPEGEGDVYDPVVSLEEMTRKAIEVLSQNRKGFFLVVEEEAIDEMAHANNARLTIKAGQELDKAVQAAKAFAEEHPDTLVLVLADHETGGLAIEFVDEEDESGGGGISGEDGPFPIAGTDGQFVVDWTTPGHTAVDIPLTATGAGARWFAGVYENTDVFYRLLWATGLRP